MRNLNTHRAAYLRALALVQSQLTVAVSVVCPVVEFSAQEREWFRAPIKGGK